MPTSQQVRDITNASSLLHHLRVSLSRVLDFFPPFCGHLEAEEQSGTTCFFIKCNNAGVQFNHAIADGVTVDHMLDQSKVFGNAIYPATITVKTGELLEHGFEWAALQINEMLASHDHEKFKCKYENWMKDPEITKLGDLPSNYFMLHSSP
ncbi:hypothetical protein MTR67_008106 [Solanum verrucosum]|uniref:Uncharacterized protein n=1 Tax=Solanum verrucosum TaxID=315347 RepID=A0AAF0TDB7_SOLVR|nr:hypothetical protein MTR67_008106 [Solanum verrucosum]